MNKIRSTKKVSAQIVAAVYGVSARTVMKWGRQSKIPRVRDGRGFFFNLQDVIAELEPPKLTSFWTPTGPFGIEDLQAGFLLDSVSPLPEQESYFNPALTLDISSPIPLGGRFPSETSRVVGGIVSVEKGDDGSYRTVVNYKYAPFRPKRKRAKKSAQSTPHQKTPPRK